MNKKTIEIPLVKATYEELQQVICELQVERYKYKSTLDKIKELNNKIIDSGWDYQEKDKYAIQINELLGEIE